MTVRCSNCGNLEDLYVVTNGEQGGALPARVMVYCRSCRREKIGNLDVSIPLNLMNPDILKQLYYMGKTASNPAMAVKIIFGREDKLLERDLNTFLDSKHATEQDG